MDKQEKEFKKVMEKIREYCDKEDIKKLLEISLFLVDKGVIEL